MGAFFSFIDQNAPLVGPAWSVDQIPDQTGRVVIVTGSTSGIGEATVKELLLHNAKVYIAARDPVKAASAIARLKEETGGKEAVFLPLDLADLKSVKEAAVEFLRLESRLDVLYCNAGVGWAPKELLTAQGFDLQFGVNVVGHFLFVELLLPLLLSTAEKTGDARVINVSSHSHTLYPRVDTSTLRDDPARESIKTEDLYSQSKFIQILYSQELASRYGERGITVIALHPGVITGTEGTRHFPPVLRAVLKFVFRYDNARGALTQLRAGLDPAGAGVWNGAYMKPWARVGEAHVNAKDEALQKKMWAYMEEATREYVR